MPKVLRYKSPKQGVRVFLATPAYSGLSASYTYALFASQQMLVDEGISCDLEIMAENCHVDDSRNILVRDFLESDCDCLVFLDSDLRWRPSDLVKLIRSDKEVIAGIYPLKEQNESYPVRLLDNQKVENGIVEVEAVPTGFLKISRRALEQLAEISPGFYGKTDTNQRRKIPLIFERTMENGTRWGGDYTFCRKWREIGGEIYIDPSMRFGHSGEWEWTSCYNKTLLNQTGQTGHRIAEILTDIQEGKENEDSLIELVDLWDNEWSAQADFIAGMIMIAREAKGRILETGSGLTTLVLAALSEVHGFTVTSLENNQAFYNHTKQHLADFGLTADLRLSEIKDYGDYQWYELPEGQFSMVVCDGPPREIGRYGLISMDTQIDGSTIIMDDAATEADVANAWGLDYMVFGNERPFLIGKIGVNNGLSQVAV